MECVPEKITWSFFSLKKFSIWLLPKNDKLKKSTSCISICTNVRLGKSSAKNMRFLLSFDARTLSYIITTKGSSDET